MGCYQVMYYLNIQNNNRKSNYDIKKNQFNNLAGIISNHNQMNLNNYSIKDSRFRLKYYEYNYIENYKLMDG